MVPRRPPCPCRWTVPPPLAWSALCCTAWHRSTTGAHRCTLIYIIIVGGHVAPVQRPAWRWYLVLVEVQHLTVCPPALRSRCIGGLCGCCIACAGIEQINGNATVNPCKRFLCCGGIKLHGRNKSRCKHLCVSYTPSGKKKSPAPCRCKAKEKPRQRGRG